LSLLRFNGPQFGISQSIVVRLIVIHDVTPDPIRVPIRGTLVRGLYCREDGTSFQVFKLAKLVKLQAEGHRDDLVRTFRARNLDSELTFIISVLLSRIICKHNARLTTRDVVG
jgi:hypothetical protein